MTRGDTVYALRATPGLRVGLHSNVPLQCIALAGTRGTAYSVSPDFVTVQWDCEETWFVHYAADLTTDPENAVSRALAQ